MAIKDQISEPLEAQKELFAIKESKVKKYQRLVVGRTGFWSLIKFNCKTKTMPVRMFFPLLRIIALVAGRQKG